MKPLDDFITRVAEQIINPIILLLAGAAFIVFIWGIFQFIRQAGDGTKREEGRRAIMWGFIGLIVIFGAYGIINVALGTFNLPLVTK